MDFILVNLNFTVNLYGYGFVYSSVSGSRKNHEKFTEKIDQNLQTNIEFAHVKKTAYFKAFFFIEKNIYI